jgi:exonuclease 3'-5' domain-containing protein 1
MNGVSLIETLEGCVAAIHELVNEHEIAIDIEGVNLCRDGRISIIQIANTKGHIYLFDITKLGKRSFREGGLEFLLHSHQVLKVIFDARTDNDALFHQYNVTMKNIYDLQVLHALKFSSDRDKYLKGLERCLQEAAALIPISPVDLKRMQQIKKKGRSLFSPNHGRGGSNSEIWELRPLHPDLLEYAANDVKYMLPMKEAWLRDCPATLNLAVEQITQDRVYRAIHAEAPAQGSHMARRDFELPRVQLTMVEDSFLRHTTQDRSISTLSASRARAAASSTSEPREREVQSWVGNESFVTADNCEEFGINDYIFEKYGMAMGLDHWWDDY